jgi:type I restriction enzyme M protein
VTSNLSDLEKRLWDSSDELRANSTLRSSEYSVPVLGLIFLRFADHKFAEVDAMLRASGNFSARRGITRADYQKQGLYLPENARYGYLLNLPEAANLAQAVIDAMHAIEQENPDLKDVLPKTYTRLNKDILIALLKNFSQIPPDLEGDAFGKIYEYFLSKFAMSEGQKGGEFFTPTSLVKLIVEVIEPYHGRIFDPACGSGGMFVQSAAFVQHHSHNPNTEISIFGQEKTNETLRLCKMNLAVHNLSGDIRQGNTYYEDRHSALGKFDFVMANPPFNVDGVDHEKIKDDPRFPFGIPRTDNANYLWIQHFYSALAPSGRAGFVMANSAADARSSELDLRRQLIQTGSVDVMVAIGSNFFYTVTLPCTLWFLDRAKAATSRRATVLFIDARHIFRQLDRAHRDFTPAQLEFISNIVRLYRGEAPEFDQGSAAELAEKFPGSAYRDVPGLCKVATLAEIQAQGYSLNPGRYVGVTARVDEEGFDFRVRLEELHEELETLNLQARELEDRISENVALLLEEEVVLA